MRNSEIVNRILETEGEFQDFATVAVFPRKAFLPFYIFNIISSLVTCPKSCSRAFVGILYLQQFCLSGSLTQVCEKIRKKKRGVYYYNLNRNGSVFGVRASFVSHETCG